MTEKKSIFATLNAINVANDKELKEGSGGKKLSYLPWAKAWELLMKEYPDASFEVQWFDGKPWLFDEDLGYTIYTSVTVNGVTRKMWLPVMDAKNNAMKDKPYSYKTKSGEQWVNAATARDISDATMRCLVKNIALFGLGLNFYYGEDISKEAAEEEQRKQNEAYVASVIKYVESFPTQNELNDYVKTLQGWATVPEVKDAILKKTKELKTNGNQA